ncbi:MAG TPA: Flp family type IVb pilin [Brevundimonas sp.]|jgi:pilus assembly protein Flp/PilA|uniref:Flp family type IVb pilin n=1 Tax=Brevundimonas sp. TaxID=1871086 RepID=UPI002C6D5935|nr:Flp family type IVb pilin [Brevundimonas sp.]HRH20766.1 Flp family type IVb pilin [Brevundimonas sp.]
MRRLIRRLLKDRSGATAIEYGLIVALMAIAIIGSLTAFAEEGTGVFNRAMNAVSGAISGDASS